MTDVSSKSEVEMCSFGCGKPAVTTNWQGKPICDGRASSNRATPPGLTTRTGGTDLPAIPNRVCSYCGDPACTCTVMARHHGYLGTGCTCGHATRNRVAEALVEVRARVYSSTLILPDGERVIPQVTMLRIIAAVLKDNGCDA